MGTLKNVHTARLGVRDAGHKLIRIQPGQSEEVERDFTDHPMVKVGWLVYEKAKTAQPKAKSAKTESESE